MTRLIAMLALVIGLTAPGVADAAPGFVPSDVVALLQDDWFEEDEGYWDDEGYYEDSYSRDDEWFDAGREDRYGDGEWGQDDYGYYDYDYEWDADDDWFDDWYGDAADAF